jgi:hypothetical protein
VPTPTTPGTNLEQPPPGEQEDIQAVVQFQLGAMEKAAAAAPIVHRGQHPKQHGVVRAEFIVADNLPEPLRVGLFREARSFKAYVRFSNGKQTDDSNGDIHGAAIKLLGVPGEKVLEAERNETTHDFILADHPVMFLRNVRDYLAFFRAAAAPGAPAFLTDPAHVVEAAILMASLSRRIANPLLNSYWSQTPFLLGDRVVRYSLWSNVPCPPVPNPPLSPDYLRQAMVEHLAKGEARFDFRAQTATDPVRMPVEDPTVEWSEAETPFVKVATLVVPPQKFDSPAQMTFCENLSFTPWHCLPEHRPLGGLNRARKFAYEASSQFRHERNQAPRREPTGEEVF